MESYLNKGLNSLIISKEIFNSIEIIVVNDGSKDRSSEIAHKYEMLFPRSIIVIDKSNGNYGSCINTGLKVAHGKYVRIMDADDSFITKNFEDFVNILKEVDVDLIFSDYIKDYGDDNDDYFQYSLPKRCIFEAKSQYKNSAFTEIQLPAITYKTEIFRKISYHQTEGISYSDMEWCFTPISQVKTAFYFNKPIYRYLLSREGQTMDESVQIHRFSHVLKSLTSILNTYSALNVRDCSREYLINQILRHLLYVYRFYLVDHKDLDRSDLREFDKVVLAKCPKAYEESGKFEYRKRIPYHYVKEWRDGNNEYIPKRILLKERIYDFLGHLHLVISRTTTKLPKAIQL